MTLSSSTNRTLLNKTDVTPTVHAFMRMATSKGWEITFSDGYAIQLKKLPVWDTKMLIAGVLTSWIGGIGFFLVGYAIAARLFSKPQFLFVTGNSLIQGERPDMDAGKFIWQKKDFWIVFGIIAVIAIASFGIAAVLLFN